MLARTRRKTRWPRRRSSVVTAGAPAETDGFKEGSGFNCAIGFGAFPGAVDGTACGLVDMGVGVWFEVDFAAGTLRDSSFKARHPRNRSQWLVIPLPRPIHRSAARLSRRPARRRCGAWRRW